MRNSLEEIKVGIKLLQLERQEDLAQYKKKFLNTTIADKKKRGHHLASHLAQENEDRNG